MTGWPKASSPNCKVGQWDDWAPMLSHNVGMNSEGVQELLNTKDSPITWKITGPGAMTWQVFFFYYTAQLFVVPMLTFMHAQSLSCVQLFETLWTVVHQAPLSMGFPRQEY